MDNQTSNSCKSKEKFFSHITVRLEKDLYEMVARDADKATRSLGQQLRHVLREKYQPEALA